LVLVGGVVVARLVILGSVGRIARVFTLLCLALPAVVTATSISLHLFVSRSVHRTEDFRNEPGRGRIGRIDVHHGRLRRGASRPEFLDAVFFELDGETARRVIVNGSHRCHPFRASSWW
jgi:hypothetical protein